jgi:hypothetical protein
LKAIRIFGWENLEVIIKEKDTITAITINTYPIIAKNLPNLTVFDK